MNNIKNLITIDKEILGGQPVFKNTRVPIESLFMHLEKGISMDEFLDDFPTVTKEQAVAILEIANAENSYQTLNKLVPALKEFMQGKLIPGPIEVKEK
jgi:uncharacterized protein (DUF433 family)